MGQTLENGIYLPSEGERNCYAGLKTNWEILDQKVADVTALQQAVAGALHREIVESLPTTDIDPNTIYMILSGTSATENVYNEYMYVNNAWELIGTSATDLTNYYTKAEVDGKLLLKANASDLTSHTGDTTIHVTTADKNKWNTIALVKQLRLVNIQVGSATTIAFANIDDTNGIKVGDKCMDLDAKMFEITAVDTTNQTVTVGTALIDLALDANVVHTSGNETVGGVKTFSNNTYITSLNFTNEVESQSSSSSAVFPIVTTVTYTDSSPSQSARLNFRITANGDKSLYPHENNQYSLGLASRRWTTLYGYLANLGGTYVGNEVSANERTNLYLLANRDTDGQSGAYIGRFRQNRAQGAMSGSDVSFVSLDFLENSTRYTRCFTMGLTDWDSDGVPQTYYITAPNGKGSLGTSYQQWNKVYANEYYYGSTSTEFSDKFATVDTAQTISGEKQFTSTLKVNRFIWFNNPSVVKGTVPSTDINPYRMYFGNNLNYESSLFNIDTQVKANGAQRLTLRCAENVVGGNDTRFIIVYNPNDAKPQYFYFMGDAKPYSNNTYGLGDSSFKWATINGLEPSALGMPDLSNGIDISSYITIGDTDNNYYTPSVNGWIWIRLIGNGASIIQGDFGANANYVINNLTNEKWVETNLFVTKDVQATIRCRAVTGIISAKFYPCQGNV